jgi:hypothetical protein
MPVFAVEAEIIHVCSVRNLPPPVADEMELWEVAAYLGLHRIETREAHDTREIVETKQAYWEETAEQRQAKMAGYSKRRKERALERKRQAQEDRIVKMGGAN